MVNLFKIDYEIDSLKFDDYNKIINIKIEQLKKDQFIKKIKTNDCDIKGYGIDNFYVISYNLYLWN